MLPELTPNNMRGPLHTSTSILKYSRLSDDVVGSYIDHDVSTACY